MRRPWLIALLAVLVGGGLWGIYEFSKPVQLVTSCELDDTLRAHKLTPENLVGAANEINELVDGGATAEKAPLCP